MAAPTMQPVKNFAFIKCNSVMEYDLLPDYLKGADQFIFADVPSTRPAAAEGTEWFASADPVYSAANGWTVNQFVEYIGTASNNTWVDAKLYRFYWNESSGEHAAKVTIGKVYVNTYESTAYNPAPAAGRMFILKASYTVGLSSIHDNYITLNGYRLNNDSGTFSIGTVSDSLVCVGNVTSGQSIIVSLGYSGYWYGKSILFIETQDANPDIYAVGQPASIADIDTEKYFPTTVAGLRAIGDNSGKVWTKVEITNGAAIPYTKSIMLEGFTDPGKLEFGFVLPYYSDVQDFELVEAHQWYAILTSAEWNTLTGRGGYVRNPAITDQQTDERQLAKTFKTSMANFDKIYHFSMRLGASGAPIRGGALFYRKKEEAEVNFVGSVMDVIPFRPVASAAGVLTGVNRLEGGIQGLRPGQVICLFAAYNDPNSTSATGTLPDTSYLKIGSDRCTFSNAKVFNTGLTDINGASLNNNMWFKQDNTNLRWPIVQVDMGRASVWISRPMRFRCTHRDIKDFGVYFAKNSNFTYNGDNSYITAAQYTYGILTAAGRILESRLNNEYSHCKPLSTTTGTATNSSYYRNDDYMVLTEIDDSWKIIDRDVNIVLFIPDDCGNIDYDLYACGDTNTYEGAVKLTAAGTYPLPRNATDLNNGVRYSRTPSPVVVSNCGLDFTYKLYKVNLKTLYTANPSFGQLTFSVRGAFTQAKLDELEAHGAQFSVVFLDDSDPVTETLDGNVAVKTDDISYATDIDAQIIDV